jgi:hypothetical protein
MSRWSLAVTMYLLVLRIVAPGNYNSGSSEDRPHNKDLSVYSNDMGYHMKQAARLIVTRKHPSRL